MHEFLNRILHTMPRDRQDTVISKTTEESYSYPGGIPSHCDKTC